MKWYELRVLGVDKAMLDSLSEMLEEKGALSVTFSDNQDEPIFEPELNTTPLWSDTSVTALFDDETTRERCVAVVKESFPNAKTATQAIEDKAWEREWLKDFKPMCFGKRLWICPSHYQVPDETAVNIILDPGLAFGTGTHETTSLCLTFLDGFALGAKTVCDYGTGSGSLAISALKLGARKAYAVDIDPQALTATKGNAARNGVRKNTLEIALVNEIELPQCDLVMANILAGPLVELAEKISSLVRPGGSLILSGILIGQLSGMITI